MLFQVLLTNYCRLYIRCYVMIMKGIYIFIPFAVFSLGPKIARPACLYNMYFCILLHSLKIEISFKYEASRIEGSIAFLGIAGPEKLSKSELFKDFKTCGIPSSHPLQSPWKDLPSSC